MNILTAHLTSIKPPAFMAFLRAKNIGWVIDVRYGSYYPSYFRDAKLDEYCKELGVTYNRYQELGNPPTNRPPKCIDFVVAKKRYLDQMEVGLASERIAKIVKTLQTYERNVCLVCYCDTEDETKCHRFWLRALINEKLQKSQPTIIS